MGKRIVFEVGKVDKDFVRYSGKWGVHHKGEVFFQTDSKPKAEKYRGLIQKRYDLEDKIIKLKGELSKVVDGLAAMGDRW